MCFDFLYDFFLNFSHANKDLARYYHNCTHVFTQSTTFFLVRFVRNLNFLDIFSKNNQM